MPVPDHSSPARFSPAYFSADYSTARRRFLEAAGNFTGDVSLEIHPVEGSGPSGETLAIDVAVFGPVNPERLVAVSSGIHGAEGFAGSALQLHLISHQLTGILSHPGTGVLLVHAVNPHGFAHFERVNERNVDLNRNFCTHPTGHAVNRGYEALDAFINPVELSPAADAAAREGFRRYADQHGLRALQAAIASGQYTNPRGLYFGGNQPEPSNRHLLTIARRYTKSCRCVAWIDVHTGLGEHGAVSAISDFSPMSPHFRRIRSWYGELAESTQDEDGTSSVTNGSVDTAVIWEFPDGCEGTLVTAEFGTYDASRVFWALRARNWLRHYGKTDSDRGREIVRDALEVFNPHTGPDADAWRAKVLEHGADVIEKTRLGLLT